MDTGTRLQPVNKICRTFKSYFCARGNQVWKQKQFLNYMVSVSRERKRDSDGKKKEKASP